MTEHESNTPPAPGASPGAVPTAAKVGWPIRWLVTWFGAGLAPRAPGTAGSIAALPFAALLAWTGGPWLLLAASLALFGLGILVCGIYARRTGRADPPEAVIDEVAGQWLTLVPAPLDPVGYGLGLLAFRVFDVAKPWPIGAIDRRVGGGLGIMADDMVAGLAGAVVVFVLSQAGGMLV
jgi:phosphatidylglycerophosphatase A